MSEEKFDPWNEKMPWDDLNTDSTTSNAGSEDGGSENVQHDVFTALEEKLRIPIGSTAESLKPHKQAVARINVDASKLALQDKMLSVQLNAGKLTPETFDNARAKVMHDALRMVDIANNFIDKMQQQLDVTVDVTDKMWAAVASMITSVTTSIEKLEKITKNIRQEEELRQIEIQKAEDAKKALESDGSMEFSPAQTNAFIFQIVEEEEKKRNKALGIITDEKVDNENNTTTNR